MAIPLQRPHDVRANLFGGNGSVSVCSLLDGDGGPFTAVLWCELTPGGSVGPHVQQEFPEIVVGIEGDGAATIDGAPRALGSGDVVHLPLGSVLSIENRSSERRLTYLIIKARG
ncbi:MAG TPA: cupin domain-containing protein [Polyangiaceae bacterium]|nr:cupin domain-containing protein [Polyangiaceae bacterium]